MATPFLDGLRKKLASANPLAKYERMYDTFDQAHDSRHMETVRDLATELAKQYYPENIDLVRAAATLHDVGLSHGREGHEASGADMIAQDPEIANMFSKEDFDILVEAIRQHRASTGNPQHIVGKIISDADRSYASPEAALLRARQFRASMDDEEALKGALEHLADKYSVGGRGMRAYFPETIEALENTFAPIREMAANNDWQKALNMIQGKN